MAIFPSPPPPIYFVTTKCPNVAPGFNAPPSAPSNASSGGTEPPDASFFRSASTGGVRETTVLSFSSRSFSSSFYAPNGGALVRVDASSKEKSASSAEGERAEVDASPSNDSDAPFLDAEAPKAADAAPSNVDGSRRDASEIGRE